MATSISSSIVDSDNIINNSEDLYSKLINFSNSEAGAHSFTSLQSTYEIEQYTVHLTKDEKYGLGFLVQQHDSYPFVSIYEVTRNGPADKSNKMLKNDVIIKVDDYDFTDMSFTQGLKMLRSLKTGQGVTLTCQRKLNNNPTLSSLDSKKNQDNFSSRFKKRLSKCTNYIEKTIKSSESSDIKKKTTPTKKKKEMDEKKARTLSSSSNSRHNNDEFSTGDNNIDFMENNSENYLKSNRNNEIYRKYSAQHGSLSRMNSSYRHQADQTTINDLLKIFSSIQNLPKQTGSKLT
jgi:hypothetical protein